MSQLNEWKSKKSLREFLAIAILLSIGYSAFNDPVIGGNLFSNLNLHSVQLLLIFSISACLFSYGVTKKVFNEWTFWAGVSGIPTGLGLIFARINRVNENTNITFDDEYSTWALLGILPVAGIAIFLVYIFKTQSMQIEHNTVLDRILGVAGLVFTLMMFWGEYLPWNRNIYSATDTNWKFKGSGTQEYISECCYLTEYNLTIALKVTIPLLFLMTLFLLRVLGFRISNLGFLGIILWGTVEIMNLLDDIGIQDPIKDAGWTESDVSASGLEYEIEIMSGGYLFMGAFIGLVITLLWPRVLKGRGR